MAVTAEMQTESEWEELTDRPQHVLMPVALESRSTPSPQAVECVQELGLIASASSRVPKSVFVMNAYKMSSRAVQTGSARTYAGH